MYSKKIVNKFIDAININNENWINYYSTNCYAYALGIDLDIGYKIIDLGEISGFNCNMRNEYDLKTALIMDCIRLNLNIEEVSFDFKIKDKNTWLISAYMTPFYVDEEFKKMRDYHFIKKTKDINWTHKLGNSRIITNRDENDKIINNPMHSNIALDSNIPYNFVGCYLLTKRY